MNSEELKARTKKFALEIIRMVESLPRTKTGEIIGRQLLRSAASVGANYRATCRAKSQADFISKIATVEEESDETVYWLELLKEAGLKNGDPIKSLIREACELTAIFSASRKSAKDKQLSNCKLSN